MATAGIIISIINLVGFVLFIVVVVIAALANNNSSVSSSALALAAQLPR